MGFWFLSAILLIQLKICLAVKIYFVSNQSQCTQNTICDGSFAFPFAGLLSAINISIVLAHQSQDFSLVLQLLSDHYVINEEMLVSLKNNPYLHQYGDTYTFFERSGNSSIANFFDTILIKPNDCLNDTSQSCSLKSRISLKTENFSLIIAQRMIIQNIVWEGVNLPFSMKYPENSCLSLITQECCSPVDLGSLDANNNCSIQNLDLSNRVVPGNQDFYHGLFLFKYSGTNLTIRACEFNFMLSINFDFNRGFLFLIGAFVKLQDSFSGALLEDLNLIIDGSLFESNYFYKGIAFFSENLSNNTNIFILNSTFNNYNIYNIRDLDQDFYGFVLIISNASLKMENISIFNSPTIIFGKYYNEIKIIKIEVDLVSIGSGYNSVSLAKCNISNFLEISELVLKMRTYNFSYNPSDLFSQLTGIESNKRLSYFHSRSSLFFLFKNNSVSLTNSTFNDITNIALIDAQQFNFFNISNSLIQNIEIIDKYFLQGVSYNKLEASNLKIVNVSSNDNPFFCFTSYNSIILKNISLNGTKNTCFLYAKENSNISIIESSFFNMASIAYGPFLRIYDFNMVIVSRSVFDSMSSFNATATCFFMYQNSNISIEDTKIANIIGYEGAILYMMEYSVAIIKRVININCTATYDTLYMGRGTYNRITIRNSSFFGMSGAIVQAVFYGVIMVDNIYVTGNGVNDTRVVIAFINTTAYLKNSFIEECYSNTLSGLVFAHTNQSYVYLNNNTFMNNFMKCGGVLSVEISSVAQITNCTFINSNAAFGGAIYLVQKNYFTMDNVLMINSSGRVGGGSIYSYILNEINIINCTIIGSFSPGSGGFLDLESQTLLHLSNTTFNILNSIKGGLIYAKDTNDIFINFCLILNSGANLGGLFYLFNFNQINVVSCSFANNSALSGGGVVFSFLINYIGFNNCVFHNVSSSNIAAGFYLDSYNKISLTNSIIQIVSSENSGAVIYTNLQNYIYINSSNFSNISLFYGDGAILFDLGLNDFLSLILTDWINFSCFFNSYALSLESNNSLEMFNNSFLSNVTSSFEGFLRAQSQNKLWLKDCVLKILKLENSSAIFISLTKMNTFRAEGLNISINMNFVVLQIGGSSYVNFKQTNFNNLSENIYFAELVDDSVLIIQAMELKIQMNEMITSRNSSIFFIKTAIIFNTLTGQRNADSFISIENGKFKANFSKFVNNFNLLQFISAQNPDIHLSHCEFRGFSTTDSGSLISGSVAQIKVFHSLFSMNFASNNGGSFSIIFSEKGAISIKNCVFLWNLAIKNGGSINFQSNNPSASIAISRSYYILNRARQGGGISAEDFTHVILENNRFTKNKAKSLNSTEKRSKGGAVYVKNPEDQHSQFENKKNIFLMNRAEIGGAIFFQNFQFAYLQIGQYSNVFQRNMAIYYGENLASSMVKASFTTNVTANNLKISSLQQNLTVLNIPSSQSTDSCLFYIVPIDKFSNIMSHTDETPPFTLDLLNETSYSNSYLFSYSQGFICLSSFQRNQLPINTHQTFKYFLDFNQKPLMYHPNFLEISFRYCQIGEKLTKQLTCDECPSGKYSLQQDFSKVETPSDCFQCKNLEFTCGGGLNMTPLLGYWRFSELSTNFIKCPKTGNCLGGSLTLQTYDQKNNDFSRIFDVLSQIGDTAFSPVGFCSLGYSGVMCYECDYDYGKVNALTCLKCYESGYDAWVSMQILIKLALIFGSLYISLGTSVSIFMGEAKASGIRLTYLIKIFLSHIQILIILFTFIEVPDPFNNIMSFSLGFSSNISEAFNLECLLKHYGWQINPMHFQFIMSLVYWIPLCLLAFLMTRAMFKAKTKIFSDNPNLREFTFWNLFLAAILIMFDLCYFDMINTSFKLFNCMNVNDLQRPEKRLLFDYSVQCDSDLHQSLKMVALIFVLFGFGLGFPLLLCLSLGLQFKRNGLIDDRSRLVLSYFYYVYQRKYFFWDILRILKKFIALSIQILLASQITVLNNFSIQILLILVLFFLFLQIRLRPYENNRFDVINRLELCSLISLSLSIYILLFYESLVSDNEYLNLSLEIFFFSIVVLANFMFALLWLYIYIPEKKREFSKKIIELKQAFVVIAKRKHKSFENIPNPNPKEISSSKDFLESHQELIKPNLNNLNILNLEHFHSSSLENIMDVSAYLPLMKISEQKYGERLKEINVQISHEKYSKSPDGRLKLHEKQSYINRCGNKKFVGFLFQDKIEHLFQDEEISVGIEFLSSRGVFFLQTALLKIKTKNPSVRIKSLKLKSPESRFFFLCRD